MGGCRYARKSKLLSSNVFKEGLCHVGCVVMLMVELRVYPKVMLSRIINKMCSNKENCTKYFKNFLSSDRV